jgi:hypothetical protein
MICDNKFSSYTYFACMLFLEPGSGERPPLKQAAFDELFTCLQMIPSADVCSHPLADACIDKMSSHTSCSIPPGTVGNMSYDCAQLAADCRNDAGAQAFQPAECSAWLNPFTGDGRAAIVERYLMRRATTLTPCRSILMELTHLRP